MLSEGLRWPGKKSGDQASRRVVAITSAVSPRSISRQRARSGACIEKPPADDGPPQGREHART